MTLAADYFARVRPLLGTGLSRHAIHVDGDAQLVVELLASCMLERVVTRDARVIDRWVAWKQPFAPLRTTPTDRIDARISARRGPASIAWHDNAVTMTLDPGDPLAYVDVSYHVALGIRDALLGRTPWPTSTPRQPFDPRGIAIELRGKHVVVVGCGSLGSEALRILAGSGARFTLVDDARVTIFNLARQWFGADDVGRPKVDALAARVPNTRTCDRRLDADAFAQLVDDDPPDLVLLATGTYHHAMLAEVLRRRGTPHVAACCYPRARYFEVSIHTPDTPCLHCYRGHLYRGAADDPVPDDVASFLYTPMPDGERAQRYTDLVAEPASRIETLRAAHVLARCAAELLAPTRSPWFARVLADNTTCLLGGNIAGAYGITHPGQVLRLGLDDIAGPTDHVECVACGRTMRVALRDDLPALPEDAMLF